MPLLKDSLIILLSEQRGEVAQTVSYPIRLNCIEFNDPLLQWPLLHWYTLQYVTFFGMWNILLMK